MSSGSDSDSNLPNKQENNTSENIEHPSSEEEYIALYRQSHPELEAEEKRLESEAKKKVHRFKPTKLTGFSAKRVEHTYYDDNGKKFAFIQERRQKPYTTEVRILPRGKKNPDKQVLASIGEFPSKTQIFQYVTSNEYIYISNGVDFIKIERKDFFKILLQCLGATVIDKTMEQDLLDADLWLQIFSKSKLPHIQIKDWRAEHKITTINQEELKTIFLSKMEETREQRKNLGDYNKRKLSP